MTAMTDLMSFVRETRALNQVAGRLGWDQETMMPPAAAPQRGEESAAITAAVHARRTDPRVGEWLAAAEPQNEVEEACIRLIRFEYDRAVRVPARLASELAHRTSVAHGVWAQARADEDVAAFLPSLREIIALTREKAEALADGGDLYDALIQDYEPGATAAGIATIFDAMRIRLVALRERLLDAPAPPGFSGTFEPDLQIGLARELAGAFGYDFTRGRLDKAVHPFSSGSGLDVRITTRTSPTDPLNCVYSTIHETGHASYEQGIDPAYLLTPLGRGVSMGVHESQSRIYENQLGRSRAFTGWLFSRMRDTFGDFGIDSPDAFYAAVNQVHSGFIRTEADEVHYNLHIMLRFDLERALFAGDLTAGDLEAAWNDRFAADFGSVVDKPSNGVLQDVHWSAGALGYFPTYALGNVYAGCLLGALRGAVPDYEAALARGDTAPATAWLRQTLQRHGGLREPRETIAHACGFDPHEGPLLDYLEAKFTALYDL